MHISIPAILRAAFLAITLGTASSAQAGMLVGGSDLLTPGYVDQLETWLGQGPITLTNIFDYKSNGTPTDIATPFHAAADGKGPTFTVIRVGDTNDGLTVVRDTNQVIGGYNPQSWNSFGGYNITVADAVRTAFLFNLTTGERQLQKLQAAPGGLEGLVQTDNDFSYGPVFGHGYDLWVLGTQSGSLGDAVARNSSYGHGVHTDNILAGMTNASGFSIQDLEIFSITPGIVATPEPSSLVICGCGILGFGAAARRRKSAAQPITIV